MFSPLAQTRLQNREHTPSKFIDSLNQSKITSQFIKIPQFWYPLFIGRCQ